MNYSLVVPGHSTFASPPLRPYSPPAVDSHDELPLLFASRFATQQEPHELSSASEVTQHPVDIISDLIAALPTVPQLVYSTNLFSSPTPSAVEDSPDDSPQKMRHPLGHDGDVDISNTVEWGSPNTTDSNAFNVGRQGDSTLQQFGAQQQGVRVVDIPRLGAYTAPVFSLSPGANLNTPPSHPQQSAPCRWDPVSSTFAMVDAVARIMEEANHSELLTAQRNTPPHQTFFSSGRNSTQPDVVCPADQLKRILMSTVSGGPLSFVAHRVGASVVIEGSPAAAGSTPLKTVSEARNKALKSKLMYFSILANSDDNSGSDAPSAASPGGWNPLQHFRKCLHWQFNDLNVMLGVNTPTVALPKYPGKEFTLQFVDPRCSASATQKHSALPSRGFLSRDEALDIWLDTIMANVDGVALCYHNDGIVEGCQVVSASHIPTLSVEPFEPIAVQMEARNVLRWLTQACSKEGGSYVVMKDPRDASLRLYDITFDTNATTSGSCETDGPFVGNNNAPSMIEGTLPTDVTVPAIKPDAFGNTPPIAHSTLLDVDDDDAQPSTQPLQYEEQVVQQRKHQLFQAFSFPVALMCLRMAQALPNSDAETLRLLLKSISMLEDGIAISKKLHIDPPNSPDSSGAQRAAPFPLAKAHALCMHHYHSSSPLADAESLCLHHAKRCLSYASEIVASTRAWLREKNAPGANAHDSKRHEFLQAQEVEVDGIVAGVTRCLGAMASERLKQEQKRSQKTSERLPPPVIAEITDIIIACEFSISLRSPWVPSGDSNEVREDVAAAYIHLETLCGEFCWMRAQLSPSLPSAANSLLTASFKFNRDDAFGAFSFSQYLPLPSSREALLTIASESFHRAALESRSLDPSSAFPHLRKCAGIYAEKAQLVNVNVSGAEAVEALHKAAHYFHRAAALFEEACDSTNAVMMSLNESKMLLRSSMLPHQSARLKLIDVLNAAMCVQSHFATEDDGAAAPQQGEQTASIFQTARAHLANVLVMCAQQGCASASPLGQLSDEILEASANISTIVEALARSGDNEPLATSSSLEAILYKLFLLPATRLAKKSNVAALESRILLWTYALHMKYAGLESLQFAAVDSTSLLGVVGHTSIEKRVASGRFALTRCRQFVNMAVDALQVLFSTVDLLATYMLLLKHASVLGGSVGSAEVTVDIVERAATSLCSLKYCLEQVSINPHHAANPNTLRAVQSALAALATVSMSLIKLTSQSGTSSNPTTVEALRAIATEAARMGASKEPLNDLISSALGQLSRLDSLFSFKAKKQTSKFL
ncbi:Hypothetical protein, putative [Bodo saltans]|uniref:EDRF1 N-terminal domain-containing protein n=1 Tax=Bodo saltans TaxID=75058 RepID=A0A0S4J5A2_BODSA|nr:Hypothetical protein, putative [Bodo saltans]|eukprot:CUG81317.1 Hypothetical protein, putative [Bodo saltans]